MLTAGWHKTRITPEVGAPLTGFAARKNVSNSVHDDLHARALVLENSGAAVALVSVDVLALPADFVHQRRARIAARTGIAGNNVLIGATHTHAGPVTMQTFFNPGEKVDPAYMDMLATAIEDAAAEAWKRRIPARLGAGTAQVSGIGVNRRDPSGGVVDRQVGLLKIEDEHGRTRVMVLNHACHPTVLGPNNLSITGDFPAAAVARIEYTLGEGCMGVFFNGAQGDVSMGHSSELSAIGIVTPGRTFSRARALGDKLAGAAIERLSAIQARDARLGAAINTIHLPLKRYPPDPDLEAALRAARDRLQTLNGRGEEDPELRRAKMELLYASISQAFAREVAKYTNGFLPLDIQGLRLGETAMVGIPGEAFVEIGLRIKQEAAHQTLPVGLANGYVGYLPTREAFQAGGYEVISSPCAPEAEDVLVEGAKQLVENLFQ